MTHYTWVYDTSFVRGEESDLRWLQHYIALVPICSVDGRSKLIFPQFFSKLSVCLKKRHIGKLILAVSSLALDSLLGCLLAYLWPLPKNFKCEI